jgi:Fe-S-cluster containining protein
MSDITIGTFTLDEATLRSDGLEPDPPPAPRVRLPAPMLAYRCNEQGCCCGGWNIPFKPRDLVRLGRVVDADERRRLTENVELRIELAPDGTQKLSSLQASDAEGDCRFLAEDRRRCGLHAKYGVSVLPDICVDFPVVTYEASSGVELHYDPICPSVLDALAASDAPVTVAERTAPYADPGLALRSAHSRGAPRVRIGAVALEWREIELIRDRVLASLAAVERPVWQHLLAIDAAYAELARGERPPEAFELRYDRDPRKYMGFLRDCIAAHGVGTLLAVHGRYRRFIFAIPTGPGSGRWHELEKHLRHWEPAFEQFLAPADDALRPLLLRYLAHRHFAPFLTIGGELRFAAGAIVHSFATALRFAAAYGAVRGALVDRSVMKAALGAGEYLYRSLEIPPDSLPWYGVLD